ncbi:MAG: nucleotide exchange factor GrpE [Clostridia bacterium]|nr:nucleotide exchange factor GrpE [Clostridia bacterium]
MKKKDKTNAAEPAVEQDAPVTEPEEQVEQPEQAAEAEPAAEEHEATAQEWQAALELAVKQRDELKDSFLRVQADFQNFKRRNQTARADGYEDGVREAIAATLPAIDNLERAIAAAEKVEGAEGLVEGVKMTLNTLMDGLKRFGFEEVPALGEDFDPEKHNAVMREAGDEPGKVLEVFQKGYRVKDRIIRYAMVKVSVEGE